jgi:hypothetical protein
LSRKKIRPEASGFFNFSTKLLNFSYLLSIVSGNQVLISFVHQSGKFIGMSKLSKRGNRHLRRAIYLMTASVVSQNAFFKAYFLKRKSEGLARQKALFATAHKLIRVIFAMLSQ